MSRRSSKIWWLALAASMLLLGSFFLVDLQKSDSRLSTVASPPGEVLTAQAADNLDSSHARATELAKTATVAEKREFEHLRDCVTHLRTLERAKVEMLQCASNATMPKTPENQAYFAGCERRRKLYEQYERSQVGDSCQEGEAVEVRFIELTDELSLAGDPDAQLCYVAARYKERSDWTEDEVKEYSDRAGGYIVAALDRGDWRMVELLRSSTPNVARSYPLMETVIESDTELMYMMNRLLRLGAEGPYAQELDNLGGMHRSQLNVERSLEADAWARQIYEKNFKARSRLNAQPKVCALEESVW